MGEMFWGPGVLTQIENPGRIVHQKRWGWGLQVSQDADKAKGADNWFHIPIPCESRTHYTGGTPVEKFIFRAKVNKNARIRALHLRDGENIIVEKNVNYNNQEVTAEFKVPKKYGWIAFANNASGITLCVRVEFMAGLPRGEVTFLGAAVKVDPAE